jgi:putative two-component system protein, hydrogenase maturation factor HypX/HoxX
VNILFLTSAHNGLSQRLLIELTDRGHQVVVTLATSDDAMVKSVDENEPDLIVAPMLKVAIPEAIYSKHTCLIVHPGIKGDRGSSSLDWAIMNGEQTWGVTILQADAGWDAGAIWASHEFSVPSASVAKSRLYRQEVTEAAVCGVLEAVEKFQSRRFEPQRLDYGSLGVRGTFRPAMRQGDRVIDWKRDKTDAIVAKINAGDGTPGVLDALFGWPFYLYGAHYEDRLKGTPGQLIAQRDGAVCVATVDGAVWITHLKAKDQVNPEASLHATEAGERRNAGICPVATIKLPATLALGPPAANLPWSPLPIDHATDYRTFQEIRYEEEQGVGRLFFDFYNGAMSTHQCYRLRDAFLFARSQPTRVIELRGGIDFFSNGIHLNVIEAAADPALESWRNINAIDDLVLEILNTMSHLVIAGLCGNAGAGGAMLALAADYVLAREGVVLNPHYRGMGLYGSEYWTYTLPRRVGAAQAVAVTEGCRPMGTREAKATGFIDDCFGSDAADFGRILAQRSEQLSRREDFWRLLRKKHERRIEDERAKPLAHYRAEELTRMRQNFYGPDQAYHAARRHFVYKGEPVRKFETTTPETGLGLSFMRRDIAGIRTTWHRKR